MMLKDWIRIRDSVILMTGMFMAFSLGFVFVVGVVFSCWLLYESVRGILGG